MEYLKLIVGIIFLVAFAVVLVRNRNRKGIIHTLFRFDTIVGIGAGIFLVTSSLISILG